MGVICDADDHEYDYGEELHERTVPVKSRHTSHHVSPVRGPPVEVLEEIVERRLPHHHDNKIVIPIQFTMTPQQTTYRAPA